MRVLRIPLTVLLGLFLLADVRIAAVKSMEDVLSGSISRWRFNMVMLGIFSALALVLAAVGIYGVLSNSVAQRTQEIGVRMALGAERGDVLRLVVGQGFRAGRGGRPCGRIRSARLTRFLSGLLYGVKPADPLTFGIVSLLFTGVALLSSYMPARRAMEVDPMVALRHE